jgi:hypothetical protein
VKLGILLAPSLFGEALVAARNKGIQRRWRSSLGMAVRRLNAVKKKGRAGYRSPSRRDNKLMKEKSDKEKCHDTHNDSMVCSSSAVRGL